MNMEQNNGEKKLSKIELLELAIENLSERLTELEDRVDHLETDIEV
jgi:hypothetical protein